MTKKIIVEKEINEWIDVDDWKEKLTMASIVKSKAHDLLVDERIINGNDYPCEFRWRSFESDGDMDFNGSFTLLEKNKDDVVIIAQGTVMPTFGIESDYPSFEKIRVELDVVEDTIGDLVDRCFPGA